MTSSSALAGILRADGLRLVRDHFLLAILTYLGAQSISMRWILPRMRQGLNSRWGLDIEPFYPVIVSYLALVLSGILVGMIAGFLLLESREDRSIKALLVSPLSMSTYLGAASLILVVVTAGMIVVESTLLGLGLPSWPVLLIVSLVGGLGAPIPALFLACFAHNKVEAFALMKFVSLAGLIPVGAYFIPEPWQYSAGLFPPYWAAKAWWSAASGGTTWPLWLLGGCATSALLTWLLARRFQSIVRRQA